MFHNIIFLQERQQFMPVFLFTNQKMRISSLIKNAAVTNEVQYIKLQMLTQTQDGIIGNSVFFFGN